MKLCAYITRSTGGQKLCHACMQSKNFEDFLEETRGTSIILTIDLNTDFHSIVEYFDKKILDIEQLRTRGRAANNHS